MRIPSSYVGKSILCPKCSAPQKVVGPGRLEPMDTTRSISKAEPVVGAAPAPRVARPPSGEFNLQTAPFTNPPAPLEAVPTVNYESDSSLARAGVPRRRGVAGGDSGVIAAAPASAPVPPPPPATPEPAVMAQGRALWPGTEGCPS